MANTKDLYTVVRPPQSVRGLDVFGFGTDQRVAVDGFYKTVMQWLKCFFTELGTDTSDPTYGTVFASYVGGASASEQDLRDVAVLSVKAATDKIIAYQRNRTLPSAERLASVTLTDMQVDADRADLYLSMVNGEGSSLQLAIPAKTTSYSL